METKAKKRTIKLEEIAMSASHLEDQNSFFRDIHVITEPFKRQDGGTTNRYYVNLTLREASKKN